MHFNWFFSAKTNLKMCIEAQKISVAIFSAMSIPILLSTSILNDKSRTHDRFDLDRSCLHDLR